MDRKYNLRLDLQFRCNNSVMKFDEFDKNTSDFFIRVTKGNKLIDISKAIVTLVAIKPDNSVEAQFVTIEDNNVYCDLKPSMKDAVGKYEAIASITVNGETVNTDTIAYEVTENKFLRQLNNEVVAEERFTILTDMINRLSTIELQENSRIDAETNRVEAEKQRELVKEKLILDIEKLILDTNSKVDTSLKENSNKVTKLISDTETKVDNYKLEKDTAINLDLTEYKTDTTQDINTYKQNKDNEINDYKDLKDTEINKKLDDYKTSVNTDIETYKNNKNAEINQYKSDKDTQIDNYVITKNKEIDNYVAAKNDDIDSYKNAKDLLIDNKLKEVDTAEKSREAAEQKRVEDHKNREEFLNSFESQMEHIATKDIEQDTRLKDIENTNKRQDVVLGGLFNENADGRLNITGEGNSLKLENSKDGVVEVKKVVGNTFVNNLISVSKFQDSIMKDCTVTKDNNKFIFTKSSVGQGSGANVNVIFNHILKDNTTYRVCYNITRNDFKDIAEITGNRIEIIRVFNMGVQYTADIKSFGYYEHTFTTDFSKASDSSEYWLGVQYSHENFDGYTGSVVIEDIQIFEDGQLVPSGYIEGLRSTFEDKLITQEQVDAGLESSEDLGKYRGGIRVVGKNLFDINKHTLLKQHNGYVSTTTTDNQIITYELKKNTNYMLSFEKYGTNACWVAVMVNGTTVNNSGMNFSKIYNSGDNGLLTISIRANSISDLGHTISDIQLEEVKEGQTKPSNYERYREHKTSILLPEPLYKGNELCVYDGQLGYWKNRERIILDYRWNWKIETNGSGMKKFIFRGSPLKNKGNYKEICDNFSTGKSYWPYNETGMYVGETNNVIISFSDTHPMYNYSIDELKAWLQANPTTVIYELAEPIFVPVLENTPQWILDSYNDCTIHIDSNIPSTSISVNYTGNVPSLPAMEKNLNNVNDEQDMQNEIDNTTMLAVADIFEMLTPAIATSNINTKEGGNKMVELYVVLIMRGLKTIEQVPSSIRPQVEEMLKQVQ